VYRPAGTAAPTVPKAAGRVVQPYIELNGKKYTSRAELSSAKEAYKVLATQEAHEFFNLSKSGWEKKKIKQKAGKEAWMKARLGVLDEMLADPNRKHVLDGKLLKDLVDEYRREKLDVGKQLAALKQGKTEVATPGAFKDDGLDNLVQALQKSGLVFPDESIVAVAKKADAPGGRGFAFELEIALRAIESAARKKRSVRVQLGKLSLDVIKMYLQGELASYDASALRPGGVGADVVIWMKGDDEKWSGKFIQAKSVIPDNIQANVSAAMSQLEGNCANAKAEHTAADREQSLIGPTHKGKIMVETLSLPGVAKLKGIAESALTSKHVKIVSFRSPVEKQKMRFPERAQAAAKQ